MSDPGRVPFPDLARAAVHGRWDDVASEAEGESERALFATTLVARRMVQDGELGNAVTELCRVLESSSDSHTLTDARIILAGAYRLLGNARRAEELLTEAVEGAETRFDRCNSRNMFGVFLWTSFQFGEAEEHLREAARSAEGLGIDLVALSGLARCVFQLGRQVEAEDLLEWGFARVELADPDIAVQVLPYLQCTRGLVRSDLEQILLARTTWESFGLWELVMRSIETEALVLMRAGDHPESDRCRVRLESSATRFGSQFYLDRAAWLRALLWDWLEEGPDSPESLALSVRDPATRFAVCRILLRPWRSNLTLNEIARRAGSDLSSRAFTTLRSAFLSGNSRVTGLAW